VVLEKAVAAVWREEVGGEKKMPRGIFTPFPSLNRLTAGGGNSGPGGEIFGPQNFQVK
jgi:hypothetical protein